MGLREAKKQQVRDRLLEVALTAFRERGYESTRVHELAAAAEVSEATFFNYFPSKDALLGGWLASVVTGAVEDAAASAPDRSLRPFVRELAARLSPRVAEDRDLVRAAFAHAAVDRGACAATLERFRAAQARGEIRADLAADELAELLTGTVVCAVASWTARPDDDPEPLGPRLLRALNLFLDGCRKRNERVRAPLAATRGAARVES